MDQAKAVVGPVVVSLQRRIPFCDGQVFFVDSRLLMGAWVESSEGQRELGVYLINTIKKPFESLIADIRNKPSYHLIWISLAVGGKADKKYAVIFAGPSLSDFL